MNELDPEPIVAALNARHVDYVVIGMFAAGVADPDLPPTADIDFTPSATAANLGSNRDAFRATPLLDEIRSGTLTALRADDLVSVLYTSNIDPVGIFSKDQVQLLDRVASAQSIELPGNGQGRER